MGPSYIIFLTILLVSGVASNKEELEHGLKTNCLQKGNKFYLHIAYEKKDKDFSHSHSNMKLIKQV